VEDSDLLLYVRILLRNAYESPVLVEVVRDRPRVVVVLLLDGDSRGVALSELAIQSSQDPPFKGLGPW